MASYDREWAPTCRFAQRAYEPGTLIGEFALLTGGGRIRRRVDGIFIRGGSARVGHPGEKWEALKERVQSGALQQFSEIQGDWLDLMWTLDAYRIAGIPPRVMGSAGAMTPRARLDAIYRGKGNWFASSPSCCTTEHRCESRLGSAYKASRSCTRSTSPGGVAHLR